MSAQPEPAYALRPRAKTDSAKSYITPPEFLDAVRKRFGPLTFDLAASADNAVTSLHFDHIHNALAQDWRICGDGWLWLNPPFSLCGEFAAKCVEQMLLNRSRILMLCPASIGTEWYANHARDYAVTLGLSPRLTFVGESAPYPKDLMLLVFAYGLTGFDTWRWSTAATRASK